MNYSISPILTKTVELLLTAPKGGFATIHNYVQNDPKKMIAERITTKNFISRFSVTKLYEKKLATLEAMNPVDGDDVELFLKAKEELIASHKKTLDGDRSDSYRKAHDSFYVQFGNGIVGHLATEKIGDETILLKNSDGIPYVESILLNVLVINSKTVKEGVYKAVKSRPLTIAKKNIESRLPKAYAIKRLSLKEGKFSHLSIGGFKIDDELNELI